MSLLRVAARLGRRVRYVPQMEMAECGAACLASLLDFWGHAAPLVEVRQACGVSRDGTSALAIVRAARGYGLRAEGNRARVDQLRELDLPLILHWRNNHFVVLERLSARDAVIMDPARGRRRVSMQELSASFSGVALSFEASPQLAQRRRASGSLARYRAGLSLLVPATLLMLGSAFLLELVSVVLPAANQIMVDHVVLPSRHAWLFPLMLGLVAVMLCRTGLRLLRDRVLARLQLTLDLSLMTSFTEHLVQLPYSFFQQRTPGDLMERVEANRRLREVGSRAMTGALDGLLVLCYAALMLAYDVRLGSLAIGLSILRILVVITMRARAQQAVATELTLRSREQAAVVEAFSVPEAVKAFGAEEVLEARHASRLAERLSATMRFRRLEGAVNQTASVLDGATMAGILWLGGNAVANEEMTLGVFAGFMALQGLLRAPLGSLVDAVSHLVYVRGILSRLDDVFEIDTVRPGREDPGALRGSLQLRDVRFRYGPSSPWVCDGVSLDIAPGEKVAIVGRIGQGKSTLARIALGMLEPSSGSICYDGRPLERLDRRRLYAQVGVVPQEPFLFDDTVRNNLSLHDPHASLDEIRRAARIACIDETICALPDGYDTMIGAGGVSFSGGQRQRLVLARALVHRPAILFLDEATSSLDADTEREVHANLTALGCTRVIIAHRLATVRDADRVLVLDGGAIVEEGSYTQLVARGGLFTDMIATLE